MLPATVFAKMDLLLWSEAEQRVPYAARKDFIANLLREYFSDAKLNLAPYLHDAPPRCEVRGSPGTIALLKSALEAQ